ncbi:MAG TPA: methyltransferase domain-containing protein [Steroidobacteraceae bacterium]|nr:methyltransferase domain-containing protein [Steroidobacteraceae bacterium]
MKRIRTALAVALLTLTCMAGASPSSASPSSKLADIIAGPQRTPSFKARDRFRHPLQGLEFFGLEPDMNVVEIWPSGGWWTEILAPYLRAHGKYYAAIEPPFRDVAFRDKIASAPQYYDHVIVTEAGPPDHWQIAPPGSVDLVLTFRNVHNWLEAGDAKQMFAAMYRALKPGGVLGLVEHRAPPGTTRADWVKTGYVSEDFVIRLARESGFRLAAKSEINANPRDTKDYPKGVWTLPPTLTLGRKDRAKYLAIGESDRMTLKFVKP